MKDHSRLKQLITKAFYFAKGEVSPKDVWELFVMSISDGQIGVRASAITLNLFLSFFPLIIVFLTLTPFVPIDHFQERLFGATTQVFSQDISDYIHQTIDDITNIPHGGLMSFGFLGAIVFSTNGIAMMLMAFEASSHVYQRRKWLRKRILSFGLLLILIVMATTAIGFYVIGEHFIKQMNQNGVIEQSSVLFWIKLAKWVMTILTVLLTYSFLYYIAPHKGRWRFFSQGGVFATIGTFILTWLLKSYLAQFNQYNLLYGSIGTLIFMIMWIYFISYVILFGFEINMSIYRAKMDNSRTFTELKEHSE